MIYIIDERKERQKEYAPFLLEQADETIKCIYSKEELDDIKQQMFSNAQFICFHDSFFKNPENRHTQKGFDEIKRDFINFCKEKEIKLVIFSGDFPSRRIDKTIVFLPVDVFYKNIYVFYNHYLKGNKELKILAFGENYKYEEVYRLRNQLMVELFGMEDNYITDSSFIFDYCKPILEIITERPSELEENLYDYIDDNLLTKDFLISLINKYINQYIYE